jgi:phage repressor protein C with HTH and peptisase S24 domain
MENPTGVSDRIKQILAHYQLNANQASQKLGHANASKVYKFLAGDFKPGYDSLVELLATFPEISGDWLLMGRGSMLRSGVETPVLTGNVMAPKPTVPQRGVSSGRVLAVTVDRTGKENTLMVSVQAQAGYSRMFNEEKFLQDMTPFHVPGFSDMSCRAFEVAGDSMYPTYKHHDIVVCTFVDRWDLLRPDESYVLVTAENVLLKRLVAPITDRRGVIELHSDNTGQYGVHTMPVADLLELWMVRGFVSTSAPGRPDSANERLREAIEELGHNYHEVMRFLNNSARGTVDLRGPLLEVS